MKTVKLDDLTHLRGIGYGEDGESITNLYKSELQAVKTAAQLRTHIKRWRLLWLLGKDFLNKPKIDVQYMLVSGRFNTKGLLKKMRQMRKPHWHGATDAKINYLAIEIMIPGPMLVATILSRQYGCPSDVAMYQLYGRESISSTQ